MDLQRVLTGLDGDVVQLGCCFQLLDCQGVIEIILTLSSWVSSGNVDNCVHLYKGFLAV